MRPKGCHAGFVGVCRGRQEQELARRAPETRQKEHELVQEEARRAEQMAKAAPTSTLQPHVFLLQARHDYKHPVE